MPMRVVFSVQNILFSAQNFHLVSLLTQGVGVRNQHWNKSPKHYPELYVA